MATNPVFTLQHIEDDGQQLTITSALPITLSSSQGDGVIFIDGTKNVVVNAYSVFIQGAIVMAQQPGSSVPNTNPTSSLSIFCQELSWGPDSSGNAASISLNGAPGVGYPGGQPDAPPTALNATYVTPSHMNCTGVTTVDDVKDDGAQIQNSHGSPGVDQPTIAPSGYSGSAAGNCQIFADSLGSCTGQLLIQANGGDGGNGCVGGLGGAGGNGCNVYLWNGPNMRWVDSWGPEDPADWAQVCDGCKVCTGGIGGAGGTGGNAGSGGNAGTISVWAGQDGTKLSDFVLTSQGGNSGPTPPVAGPGGAGGAGGASGTFSYCLNGDCQSSQDSFGNWILSSAGSSSVISPPNPAATGSTGSAGSSGSLGTNSTAVAALADPSTFASQLSTQQNLLYMLLLRARGAYALGGYDATRDGIDVAYDLLKWLSALPSLTSGDFTSNVAMQAGVLFNQMSNLQRDYFGHDRRYMPRLDFSTCISDFNTQLTAYTAVYGAWQTYTEAADADKRQMMINALQTAQVQQASLIDPIAQQNVLKTNLETSIETATTAMQRSQDALFMAYSSAEAAIKAQATKQGCSLDLRALLGSMGQIAFMPEDASAIDSASFLAWSQAPPQLASLLGKQDKVDAQASLLVTQLDQLGQGLATFTDMPSRQGNYEQLGPNAYKVLAEKADFDKVLLPFQSIPEVVAAQQAMNNYVGTVQDLNNQILQYNSCVAQLLALQSQQEQLLNTQSSLGADVNQLADPEQLQYVQYLYGLTQTVREACLSSFNDAVSSYNVWALKNRQICDYLTPPNIDQATPAVFSSALALLQNDQDASYSGFGNAPQLFPSGADQPVMTVVIEDPTTLQLLRKNGKCDIFLPAVTLNDSGPFNGWANVRLHDVTIDLPGAEVAAGPLGKQLHCKLIAGTSQYFTDLNNQSHQYNFEDPVQAPPFTKDSLVPLGQPQLPGTPVQAPPAATSNVYPQFSPFTTWHLTLVDGLSNPMLDLSQVNKIVLNFSGWHHDFTVNQNATAKNLQS